MNNIISIRLCLDYLGQGGVEIIVNSLTMSEVFGFLTSDPCGTIICDALKELKGLAVRDVSVRKITDSNYMINIYGSFRFQKSTHLMHLVCYIIDTPLIDTQPAICPAIGPFPFTTWLNIFMQFTVKS